MKNKKDLGADAAAVDGAGSIASDQLAHDDALMMAVSREWELPRISEATGIDARWLQAFVALRIADVLAQLGADQRLKVLDVADRAWLRSHVDNLVEDVIARFTDAPVGDWQYQPQDEPEYDFDGKTESEKTH